jgi:hypothetical protein
MQLLSRELQHAILERLSDVYPDGPERLAFQDFDQRQLTYNVRYLQEHGLVTTKWFNPLDGPSSFSVQNLYITEKGIDFITDDGGLSAILGVMTIRLHEDTIRQLLIDRVEKTVTDPTVKAQILKKIRELPASAFQTVVMDGIKAGLESVPDLVAWLAKIL